MAFSKLQGAVRGLRTSIDGGFVTRGRYRTTANDRSFSSKRGVADVRYQDVAGLNVAPKAVMEELISLAAMSCTQICRKAIISNMRAAGIQSDQLEKAINASYAYFGGKGRAVIFRLRDGLKREGDKRKHKPQAALYVQAASLDAGWVLGGQHVGARAKRKIKAGTAGAKTAAAVAQVHNGSLGTRAAVDLGAYRVIPGRNFWNFNAAQRSEIKKRFRNVLATVLAKRGYVMPANPTGKAS